MTVDSFLNMFKSGAGADSRALPGNFGVLSGPGPERLARSGGTGPDDGAAAGPAGGARDDAEDGAYEVVCAVFSQGGRLAAGMSRTPRHPRVRRGRSGPSGVHGHVRDGKVEAADGVPCAARLRLKRDDGMAQTEKAVLAGGCFWGMQDLVRKQPGVVSTRVGYTGGEVANATYRNHEGHAEAIEILYDPERTSYRNLLEFFFQIHDPSTKDRQGNDIGSSYRSAIFYTNEEQRETAERTIRDVDASGLWPGKVVTEVEPAGDFWEAEPEHQDYLVRYPDGYTCHFPRPNWKLPSAEAK